MAKTTRLSWVWVVAAFALGASATTVLRLAPAMRDREGHGVESRSGFVMQEADRRKSRAYLSFMYGLLYQERGQRDEAAERFAEACALDRVLQPSFESDSDPS